MIKKLLFLLQQLVIGLVLFAACSGSAISAEHTRLDAKARFAEQRADIEKKLADGETYVEINSQNRALVLGALNRISTSLEGSASMDTLPENVKISVFNDQALINQILTKAGDDSRLVCTREQQTGSHRKVNTCMTVAQRRKVREESTESLRRNTTHPQLKSN